jgi:hypothetical protein
MTTRTKQALLYGLRKLSRAKDVPHRLRWEALQQLRELETLNGKQFETKFSTKKNKLQQLIERASGPGLPGNDENNIAA